MNLNIDQARHNMIANQIRPWDVLDPVILDVLGRVHREDFVPSAWRNLAFVDLALPLGHGEVMMKPVVEGRLLQSLDLAVTDTVLEIGTGSGYLTACMASLASHVTSVELYADLATTAQHNLDHAGASNTTVKTEDAWQAFQPVTTFDVVAVTGAVETIPERFLAWLKPGGRAFFVHGHSPAMQAVLVHREGDHDYREQRLFETDLPYLVHAAPAPAFHF